MPTIRRQVDTEMTHDEVRQYLLDYLEETPPVGVRLVGEDGKPGEDIREGDYLIPKPDIHTSAPVMQGTYVYVVQTIPRAGVFLGLFATPNGQRGYSLLGGGQFSGKYVPTTEKPKRNPRR